MELLKTNFDFKIKQYPEYPEILQISKIVQNSAVVTKNNLYWV